MKTKEQIIKEKVTIQFKKDTLAAIAEDDEGPCAEFIRACLDYDNTGVIKTDFRHASSKALFRLAVMQLDEYMDGYVKTVAQRIDAAGKRWAKEHGENK